MFRFHQEVSDQTRNEDLSILFVHQFIGRFDSRVPSPSSCSLDWVRNFHFDIFSLRPFSEVYIRASSPCFVLGHNTLSYTIFTRLRNQPID